MKNADLSLNSLCLTTAFVVGVSENLLALAAAFTSIVDCVFPFLPGCLLPRWQRSGGSSEPFNPIPTLSSWYRAGNFRALPHDAPPQ